MEDMPCKLQGLCQCEVAKLCNPIPHCPLLDVITLKLSTVRRQKVITNVRKEGPLATRSLSADIP